MIKCLELTDAQLFYLREALMNYIWHLKDIGEDKDIIKLMDELWDEMQKLRKGN